MKIAENDRTTVLYESPHRLVKLLGQLQVACGSERQACVAREISKIHEEFFRGTLAQCLAHFEKGTVKGEIVVILGAA
jgi:16S rRNA (cytidine1402-2'-O)-methyltransferase